MSIDRLPAILARLPAILALVAASLLLAGCQCALPGEGPGPGGGEPADDDDSLDVCDSCVGSTEYCADDGTCVDDCAALQCGPGPVLGLECGPCGGATDTCTVAGACVDDCAGRECGLSPLEGFECGLCPDEAASCSDEGVCVDPCVDVECGPSPVDGSMCGSCVDGNLCHSGTCADPLSEAVVASLGVVGTHYDVVGDATGRTHLFWIDFPAERYQLNYGLITDSGVEQVEQVELVNRLWLRHRRPRMSVRPDGGTVHVIWTWHSDLLVHVWRGEDGTWHEEVVYEIGADGWKLSFPSIGVDLTGAVHLVAEAWKEGQDDSMLVYFRKPAGGEWSAWSELEPNYRQSAIFIDQAGGIHATWGGF